MGRGEGQAPDLGRISCERGGRSSSRGHFRWGTARDFGEKLPTRGGLHTASSCPTAASATDLWGLPGFHPRREAFGLFFLFVSFLHCRVGCQFPRAVGWGRFLPQPPPPPALAPPRRAPAPCTPVSVPQLARDRPRGFRKHRLHKGKSAWKWACGPERCANSYYFLVLFLFCFVCFFFNIFFNLFILFVCLHFRGKAAYICVGIDRGGMARFCR